MDGTDSSIDLDLCRVETNHDAFYPIPAINNHKCYRSENPRPPNSFILFRRDVAPRMKDRYPSLSNIQISKRLGNLWRIAPLHVKEVYTMRYQKAKEVFEQNNPGYKLQRRSTHDIKRRKTKNQFPEELLAACLL